MAAVRCPHCNKYISSTLSVCPECGVALRPEELVTEEQSAGKPTPRSRFYARVLGRLSCLSLLLAAGVIGYNIYMGKGGGQDAPASADTLMAAAADSIPEVREEPVKKSPVLELTHEERQMLRGALDLFLTAMTGESAGRIDSLIAQPFAFGDSLQASGQQVLNYCKASFHREDILGVHFAMPDSLSVQKLADDTLDIYHYDVSTRVEVTFNRSSLDSILTKSLRLDARFTPDRKVRSFRLREGK